MQKARVINPIIVVCNGEEAIAQLQESQADGELRKLPKIASPDVRMPGKDGLQVLKWIKQQVHFQVMLSHYGEIGTAKTA